MRCAHQWTNREERRERSWVDVLICRSCGRRLVQTFGYPGDTAERREHRMLMAEEVRAELAR